MLVSLLGLGSDQVEKATVHEHNVEAYYIDEHRGVDAEHLRTQINAIGTDEWNGTTILLFISPASLSDNKKINNHHLGFLTSTN